MSKPMCKFRIGDEVRLTFSGNLYIVQSVDPVVDLDGYVKPYLTGVAIGVVGKNNPTYWGFDYYGSWELVKRGYRPQEQLMFDFMRE